jgi:penicillin-binding protein 2
MIALQLQVFRSTEYSLHSDRNRLRKISIPAPRGLILDCKGKLLADNIPSYSLYLIPFQGDSVAKTLRRLEQVLPLNEKRKTVLAGRLSRHSFSPVKVVDNVNIAVRSFLEEHRGLIPGLLIRSEPLRYYRFGHELSHVIGYVGETSPSDMEKMQTPPPEEWGFIGREGLELYYEEVLRGRPGNYFVEVDARGREIGTFRGRDPVKPKRGTDISLSIDLDLQLEAHRLFPEGDKGVLICIDPGNGEILAMLSKPDYDPNTLVTGISSDLWQEMVNDPGSPLFNRVSQATYPPGSTFKLALALTALKKGVVDLKYKEPIPCFGGIQYGNRWFGCWKEEGHGSLDLYQAIVQSCDTYFYQLGDRIGMEALLDGARELGFAAVTGSDIPHEARGFLPNEQWYNRQYGKRGWGKGVTLNLSIGQGEILVTPLQLAAFYAMIANGGYEVQPHLIRNGSIMQPEPGPVLPEEVIIPLQQALAGVILEEHGTARYAAMRIGIEMAGKTGTAQNPHGDDHSIFVGYAPIENPQILAVAIVEGAGHGSSVAAPLVGQLLKRYLEISNEDSGAGDREGMS